MSATEMKDKGNKFFKSGNYNEAVYWYTKAIELDGSNHVFYSNRAQAYINMNKFAEAEQDGLKCISLNKNFIKGIFYSSKFDSLGYHRAAKAELGLHKYMKAVETLNQGLRIVPNEPSLMDLLKEAQPKAKEEEESQMGNMTPAERLKQQGNDLFKSSKFTEAIEKYTKALEMMDTSGKLDELAISCFNNRAACYQQLGNYENVVADCSRVLEEDPKNIKALLRRGLAFESLERYRSALEDIRNVLIQNPNIEMANKAQHRIGNAVRILKKNQD